MKKLRFRSTVLCGKQILKSLLSFNNLFTESMISMTQSEKCYFLCNTYLRV